MHTDPRGCSPQIHYGSAGLKCGPRKARPAGVGVAQPRPIPSSTGLEMQTPFPWAPCTDHLILTQNCWSPIRTATRCSWTSLPLLAIYSLHKAGEAQCLGMPVLGEQWKILHPCGVHWVSSLWPRCGYGAGSWTLRDVMWDALSVPWGLVPRAPQFPWGGRFWAPPSAFLPHQLFLMPL